MFCPGGIGGGAMASGGTSAVLSQRPPVQIGWFGSPCSNSTQTPAPTGGTMNTPDGGAGQARQRRAALGPGRRAAGPSTSGTIDLDAVRGSPGRR